MIRIYDAAFSTLDGNEHQHLAKFWWVDSRGNTGTWTRLEAHTFVASNPVGYVYVSESGLKVTVFAHQNRFGTKWIQTAADGRLRDNLVTLALRHRQGLINN